MPSSFVSSAIMIRGKEGKAFCSFADTVYLSIVNSTQALLYFDRYDGRLKSEGIYGEKPLRWAYETMIGRICLEAIIKKRWFSRLYGRWADSTISRKEIAPFLRRFGVDSTEFLNSPESFRTFNEFFYRRLKPEARPVAAGEKTVIFPADGRHFFIPDLSRESTLYAKGQRFDLTGLLGDATLAERFAQGSAILSRLCPTDYHRFHFPIGGTCGDPKLINGSLYSVNPIALSRQLGYIIENKRRITVVKHAALGEYLFLEIGATNVGSIVDTCKGGESVAKGAEKGYFRFGGSMIITLFPPGTLDPAPDLAEQSSNGVELYARFGDRMGSLRV
jgi:phosphatidylserine decarboxylase